MSKIIKTTQGEAQFLIKEEYPMWSMGQGYRWVVFARKPSNVNPYHTKALFTMPTPPWNTP